MEEQNDIHKFTIRTSNTRMRHKTMKLNALKNKNSL